jgi:ABC-type amino acid transport substrate-binding protein
LGTLRIQSNKLLRYGILSAALVALTIGGSRFAFERILENEYHKDKVLESMHLIRSPGPATVFREPPAEPLPAPGPGETHLDRIKERDAIRVGYLTDGLPYSYFNISGDLVGFDVEMAHELAQELSVDLELVPVDRLQLAQQLDGSYCDIVMAGIGVTTLRARDMLFSDSYMDETAAFVVKDHDRARFASMEDIQNIASLKLRVPNLPSIISFVHQRLPHAEIVPISSTQECFEGVDEEFDACFMTAERGSALCLLHPQFTVVVPMPNPSRVPLAYPVAGRDEVMADFMNTWIQLKKKEGFVQSLYDYWILGKDAEPKQPRWSILRNVLHWVE